ncbi:MAG: hypothetical protein AB1578_19845, partial [Thermodesulfobacteriota bacterium]
RTLRRLLPELRIDADVEVVLRPPETSIRELIQAESRDADAVLPGLATPEQGKEEEYALRLAELADGLPTFFFVKNASLFVGELVSAGAPLESTRVPLPGAESSPTPPPPASPPPAAAAARDGATGTQGRRGSRRRPG